MTSTHAFEWESCNEPGNLNFDLVDETISIECEVSVRRCCELHIEEDKHKTHAITLVFSVRGDEDELSRPITIHWMTKEEIIGPSL